MLQFLNEHFTHENIGEDGNPMNYKFPTEIPLEVARAENKGSNDDTDEEGGIIEGFSVEGLKNDATS